MILEYVTYFILDRFRDVLIIADCLFEFTITGLDQADVHYWSVSWKDLRQDSSRTCIDGKCNLFTHDSTIQFSVNLGTSQPQLTARKMQDPSITFASFQPEGVIFISGSSLFEELIDTVTVDGRICMVTHIDGSSITCRINREISSASTIELSILQTGLEKKILTHILSPSGESIALHPPLILFAVISIDSMDSGLKKRGIHLVSHHHPLTIADDCINSYCPTCPNPSNLFIPKILTSELTSSTSSRLTILLRSGWLHHKHDERQSLSLEMFRRGSREHRQIGIFSRLYF